MYAVVFGGGFFLVRRRPHLETKGPRKQWQRMRLFLISFFEYNPWYYIPIFKRV